MFKIILFLLAIGLSFLIFKLIGSNIAKNNNFLSIINIMFFTFIILIIIFFYVLTDNNINKKYNSPTYDGNKIIPGNFSDVEE
tara:strand:+ start:927 stop:1175 length:249 start_codon:yes stop_codon:yes gene_type:complete